MNMDPDVQESNTTGDQKNCSNWSHKNKKPMNLNDINIDYSPLLKRLVSTPTEAAKNWSNWSHKNKRSVNLNDINIDYSPLTIDHSPFTKHHHNG